MRKRKWMVYSFGCLLVLTSCGQSQKNPSNPENYEGIRGTTEQPLKNEKYRQEIKEGDSIRRDSTISDTTLIDKTS